MSSNEKTKNKLMETMRMTKADPGKKPDVVETKPMETSQEAKPVKNKKKNATAKKAVKNNQNASANAYQAAQRVWPD